MSVVIKGMKMPKSCMECQFHWEGIIQRCGLKMMSINVTDSHGFPHDCPLVELPEKHGRLIDVDAFKLDYGMKDDCSDCEKECQGKTKACEYDYIYRKMDFCGWLDDAFVVIEAEGKEE